MSKRLIMVLLFTGLLAMFWPAPSVQAACPLPPGYWKFQGMSGTYQAWCYWCPSWRTYDNGKTWVDYGQCCGWWYKSGLANVQIKLGANNPGCDKDEDPSDCDTVVVAQFGDPNASANVNNKKCTTDDGDPTRFGVFDFDCQVEGWAICINYGKNKKGDFLQAEGIPGLGQEASVAFSDKLDCTKGNRNCKGQIELTYGTGACPPGYEKGFADFIPTTYLGVSWSSTNGFTYDETLQWWLTCYERDEYGKCIKSSLGGWDKDKNEWKNDFNECEQEYCSIDATAIVMACDQPGVIDPETYQPGDTGPLRGCDGSDLNCEGCWPSNGKYGQRDINVPPGLGEVVYNYAKTGVLRPLPYTPTTGACIGTNPCPVNP